MKDFWKDLPRPFFVLAPMADVTDAAFRRMIAKYSKSHGEQFVMYTEFVSADGLALAPEAGRAKLMRDLVFSEAEKPIIAQFFTSTPLHMEKAAALAQEMGFDGIDINMGCPADAVEKQGAGAKLILNPTLAAELVAAAKRGAPNIPISVKTRLGYNSDILEEWLPQLLKTQPATITIHARTRKEMSAVPARWERVKRAVEIRNEVQKDMADRTFIIGNGDALDMEDARKKAAESGADGVMLGRAIFGKPWMFVEVPGFLPPLDVRLRIAAEHSKMFEEMLGDIKSFAIMKKHFKAYAEGFDGAKELRVKLMETHNAEEVANTIEDFLR